jgi:hypothetical protein
LFGEFVSPLSSLSSRRTLPAEICFPPFRLSKISKAIWLCARSFTSYSSESKLQYQAHQWPQKVFFPGHQLFDLSQSRRSFLLGRGSLHRWLFGHFQPLTMTRFFLEDLPHTGASSTASRPGCLSLRRHDGRSVGKDHRTGRHSRIRCAQARERPQAPYFGGHPRAADRMQGRAG